MLTNHDLTTAPPPDPPPPYRFRLLLHSMVAGDIIRHVRYTITLCARVRTEMILF